MHERLVRIRKTARRLAARCRAEEAFGKLGIEVTGVIWEDSGALALVNGRLLRRGDTVEGASVEEIRPSEVIFRFRDVLVQKEVR